MNSDLGALVECIFTVAHDMRLDGVSARKHVADLIEDHVAKQTMSLQARVRRLEGMIRPGDTGGAG